MQQPKISVIMRLYNGAEYMNEAIDSLVSQTYKNWELIMCDDGSTDDSYECACVYLSAGKFMVIKNDKNEGLNYTLNMCIAEATGEYIAMMDADDICEPERFEREIQAFAEHPEISIVSSNKEYYDDAFGWKKTKMKEFPESSDFENGLPFCYEPCMIRKSALEAVGGYTVSKKLQQVENYHLLIKMYSAGYKGMNIQECLYIAHDGRGRYQRRKYIYRINEFMVMLFAAKELKLSKKARRYAFKPLLIGLLPAKLYRMMRINRGKSKK